jgi:hypothetical protein
MNSKAASSRLSQFDELYQANRGRRRTVHKRTFPTESIRRCRGSDLDASSRSAPTIVWTFRIRCRGQSTKLLRKEVPIAERTIAWVKEDLTNCGLKSNVFQTCRAGLRSCAATVPRLQAGFELTVALTKPAARG